MESTSKDILPPTGQTAQRKDSHLDLALQSQSAGVDDRFFYEPLLSAHPDTNDSWKTQLGEKVVKLPIWISSMTGGTERTNEVNRRLATAAARYGLGMGVGSVRIALEHEAREEDFQLRKILGDEAPFYLNFGIAQIEKLLRQKEVYKAQSLLRRLDADGFIIHVNPLQEWMQPEGDQITEPPIRTIINFLEEIGNTPLIVKEVGQGFGPESLRLLLELPLTAVEFAAAGGTNFSRLELMRNEVKTQYLTPFIYVGHTAAEMVEMLNKLVAELGEVRRCNTVIISGGIKNFLDGYYCIQKSRMNALYGQASGFLKYALESQEALNQFIQYQKEGLLLARAYLKIKE